MSCSGMPGNRLLKIYRCLFEHYGTQDWWPGDSPFEVMVGAVLTQNTAWSNVEKAIANLVSHDALDAEVLLKVPQHRLAEWIKPSGYFNIKAFRLQNFCRWYVNQGAYPALAAWSTAALRTGLLSINGVGPETADDIFLYAFTRPVFVIDAYTRRLFPRLAVADGGQSYEELRTFLETNLSADVALYNEYHALIVRHGKNICRPKPRCRETWPLEPSGYS